ncbi:MAG: ComEA family DNA-binding protein [Moraxellaceae bacterium]|nr:ComEA family DNA-binding protein [Moraxellaceae bacterium]
MFVNRFCYVLLGLSVCFSLPLKADEAKYCATTSIVATTKATASSNTININTANADELSKLKGIGKAKAAAIMEWRETNGKFSSLEDVDEVKGIGPALLEKNKALIRFED